MSGLGKPLKRQASEGLPTTSASASDPRGSTTLLGQALGHRAVHFPTPHRQDASRQVQVVPVL